uniref:Insulin degrading enzyme n=1 Tax=Oryza rufipogon TaxID=4529 RepID=A0A0E0QA39_ORYRU
MSLWLIRPKPISPPLSAAKTPSCSCQANSSSSALRPPGARADSVSVSPVHARGGESAAAMDSRPREAPAPAEPSGGAAPAAANGEVEITKPRNDKRGYRRVVLPNALECLVISDPDTDKAAASMNVSVGYFCDPEGLPGLAHFLEHMLFYASEKYPIEDSYSKYIAEHGGSRNAFTSREHTNFFFDVNNDCLDDALDRFAQFFINPLMSPDAILREVNAVDSENQKNLLTDILRMSQLQKHICLESHPYHKFSTGNRNTLLVNPNKEGLDILEELITFYSSHYSANLMQLVVYGKESLDNLQTLVENKFSDVRNTGRKRFSFYGHPCSSEHLQVLVKAVPIKQGHTLRILWPITPNIQHYKEGPCKYVSHLVGHEGKGSLFYVLKKLGWAMSLRAGEGDWSSVFSFFSVVIRLTDVGHEHMEDIIGLLFRYITLLQTSGTPKWIFDELLTIRETGFHYRDKSPPSQYVVNISSNMQIFPPEDWLIASSVPSKFSPDAIQSILNDLTPDKVRIFWESKKFEGQTNLTEPWYGTSYSVEAVPPSIIQNWVNRAPMEDLHIPKPNIFIPSDLSLKNVEEKGSFPCMLRKTLFCIVWYKPDTMFFTPKAYIKMYFHCPLSRSSPESIVLTDMFTRLLMDYLNDYAYDAQVAGLYYAVKPNDTGFQITMVGYNDKMRTLLETVIGKIAAFEVKVDRFVVIKETITKAYENFKFQQPHQQASYYCSLILEEQKWTWDEKLAAISHTEARNMEPGEVKGVIQHVEDILFNAPVSLCKALPSSQHLTKRIVKLERGLRYYYPALCLNQQDENSSLLHYIQIHQDDLKQNVLLQLLALVAKQPAFHQLRSVEQLGYITWLKQRNDSGVRGLQFTIQSTVKDPANLDARVEAFLKMFEGTLYQMPDIEFKSDVNALINMKLEKYKNIREESAFFWREISEGTLKFDRKEAEVAALRDLKKEELIEFFDNHVKVNAPRKKILSIQVYGRLHTNEYEKEVETFIWFIQRRSTAPTSLAVSPCQSQSQTQPNRNRPEASRTQPVHAIGGESAAADAMDSRPPETDAPAAAAAGDVEITRPRNDKRGYRRVVLPNDLECLLVSDPDTDKAAASMNVSVGYFCDPEGLEGLAHFLEHMLFYASEKYPIEDSYSKYITEHGGSTNAFTTCEHTNFFFDVNHDCLNDALDRFAQFFIKPLLSADATLREIKAVDSENQKNLLSDPWRMNQLQNHISLESHPYHKFGTGNWDTLEVKPKEKGLDTRLELIKFYDSHYSANLMQLVRVLTIFKLLLKISFVVSGILEGNDFPFLVIRVQVLVKAVPIKQGHTLRILWPITPNIRHYKEGPCKYVSHLIGHEGEGSLFYVLKKLGWAMSLEAGEGDWSYEFSFFSVVIKLTDVGHEHMEDIVGLLFRYITLLQTSGTLKWIFDELQTICETGFHYRDKGPPIHYVANISSNMQIYPPEDWLIASSVPSKFSPDAIQGILNELTPDNVRIFWESKKFEGQTNLTEPWYGTSYSVEAVPPSIIQKWVEKAPVEDLHMPKPNIFLPSDLSLKNAEEKASFPCMLRKTLFSRVWYKPDTMFFTPKAYIKMDFHCPLSRSSPESSVLTDVFTRLLMDYLNDYAYDAQVAGLYYGVRPNDTGFQITMVGYNDKMRTLLETVIGKIAEFEVKADRFSVIKETITKEYENFKFRQPYQQAFYYCSLILEEQTWAWDEELAAVSQIEASDLENLCKALPSSQHLTKRIVKLERGLRYYYPALCLNHQDENSCLLHYIQIHQDDLKKNVILQLLALVAKQPAFHQLRSVEQLGYITLLRQKNDSGVRGLQFIIQSTVKDPANLDARVEAFLTMFEGTLYQMPDTEFKSNVNALIDMKLEKYKNIREESAFFWGEISEGTLKFDRKEVEVAALRDLKKEELIEFFNNHVKVNAPQKKILSIQVYGGLHSSEYEKIVHDEPRPNSYQITDIFNFRRSRPLYGSYKGGVGQMKL